MPMPWDAGPGSDPSATVVVPPGRVTRAARRTPGRPRSASAVTFPFAVYAVTACEVRAWRTRRDGLESAAASEVSTTAPWPIATVTGRSPTTDVHCPPGHQRTALHEA